jgi:ABC-type spermidine/putrescine transport system permease subunit II
VLAFHLPTTVDKEPYRGLFHAFTYSLDDFAVTFFVTEIIQVEIYSGLDYFFGNQCLVSGCVPFLYLVGSGLLFPFT